MSEKIPVEVEIGSTNDPKGTDAAAKGLKDTENAASSLKKEAADLGYSLDSLKTALLDLVAVAAVLSFFKDATTGALDMEKAMRGVDEGARRFGQDIGGMRGEVEKASTAISLLAGVSRTEVTESITKAYNATGDMAQAITRASLAADIYSSGAAKSFAQANDMIEGAVRGKLKALERDLDVTFAGTTAAEKQANAIKYLEERFKGATARLNDHAKAMDQATARTTLMKEELGAALLPALTWVIGAFRNLMLGIKEVGDRFGTAIVAIGENFVNFKNLVVGILHGDLRKSWDEYQQHMEETNVRRLAGFAEAEAATAKAKLGNEKALQDELARMAAAHLVANAHIGTEAAKATKDVAKEVHDYELDLLRAQASEAHDPLQKLTAEYALAAAERVKSAQDVFRSGVEIEPRLTQVIGIELAKRQKAHDAYVAYYKKAEAAITADVVTEVDSRLAVEAKTELVSEHLRAEGLVKGKAYQKEKLAMEVEIANTTIGLLGTVFGESKALSVAAAIVSTYEGAAKAISQGGIYGAVLAAVVIAAGLAQVAKIESTEPATTGSAGGSGFDDPSNDRAAFMGGRKWAGDMIRNFGGGASSISAGWSSGMGVNTSTDNSRHTTNNYNIGGGILDPNSREGMKIFARRLAQVQQQDSQRIVARR